MRSDNQASTVSKNRLWAGRIITGLPALFLFLDAVGKLVKPAPVVEGTLSLGYPESVILPLGIVLIVCTLLYVIPRTSVLGAILLTGYLGGAVATHVRAGSGLFPVFFPFIKDIKSRVSGNRGPRRVNFFPAGCRSIQSPFDLLTEERHEVHVAGSP